MVTSITSGRLVVFKKTVWGGIKPKHEKCSSHGNVDLGEILFTFQNIYKFPEAWVMCSYIGLETAW